MHLVRSSCHDEVDVKTSSLMVCSTRARRITGTAVTRCSPVDQCGSATLMQADGWQASPPHHNTTLPCHLPRIRNYFYGSCYSTYSKFSYPTSAPCLRNYVNSRVHPRNAASVSRPSEDRNQRCAQIVQPYENNVDYKCKQLLQKQIPIHNHIQKSSTIHISAFSLMIRFPG